MSRTPVFRDTFGTQELLEGSRIGSKMSDEAMPEEGLEPPTRGL
jgi:hypothetical protein